MKQIEEYLEDSAIDPVIDLMSKPAYELTEQDKRVLLDNFFLANPSTVIARSPRYNELYQRWISDDHNFSEQDLRDLAIHYSLAWTGEINRRTEPWKHLVEQDRDFSEEDRKVLVAAQREAVKEVFAIHKRLAKRGQVELSTTPFYHPILPLLIDTKVARESMRDVSLPIQNFQHYEDARLQLTRAREYFKHKFGIQPKGVWPSEGSISDAALNLIAEVGFEWAATDEGVLERSLGHSPTDLKLVEHGLGKYTPWRFESGLTLFFRDHRISDNIGFTYQSWNPTDAVNDLIGHVENIRAKILEVAPELLPSACVSVILDGENCWEYYNNNGFEFLDTLYAELEKSESICTCTMSEAASEYGEEYPTIPHVVAGSWINSNFRIWIGHPEDNAAWDALARARRALAEFEEGIKHLSADRRSVAKERLEQAREQILIAEGSDWCWWYGDDHYSAQRDLFDAIFRQHLRAAYVMMDRRVPEDLLVPIFDRPDLAALYHRPSQEEPRPGQVPHIAGKLLNDSWIGIPNGAPPKVFGAMHRSFDHEIEDLRLARVGDEVLLRLIIAPAVSHRSTVLLQCEDPDALLIRFKDGRVEAQSSAGVQPLKGYFNETLECAIPAVLLHGTKHLRFKLEVTDPDGTTTDIPDSGTIECSISEIASLSTS
jgi:alpha-amylase/alpha-mannosidase (GH57 family)